MSADRFSDEDLVAYIDGEQDAATSASIRHALKCDADLLRRMEALQVDLSPLPNAFAQLTPTSLDSRKISPIAAGRLRLAASLAAALLIGTVIGNHIGQRGETWHDYVAAYHSLYSNQTLADVDMNTARRQSQLSRIAALIGKDFLISDLEAIPEITFVRAQALTFRGQPLLQFSLLSRTGEPFVLCIIRASGDAAPSPVHRELEGLQAATWSNSDFAYILIGGSDAELIHRLSSIYANTRI